MLPSFTILRPESLADACDLLVEHDGDAVAYAGGTELVVAMKLGLADYPVLIDLKGVPGLDAITVQDGTLRIGATVTHRRIERSPEIVAVLPALAALEQHVANPRVRGTGTIGGNLAFGEPHSDPATFLVAAGARVACRSAGGSTRIIEAADLLAGPFETVLAPDELLVEIQVPVPEAGTAMSHQRFVLTERPAAAVSVRIAVRDGVVTDARIAVGAASPVPASLPEAARLLLGTGVDAGDALLRQVGSAAAETMLVESAGDEAYLRHLVSVLVRRGVCDALDSLTGRNGRPGARPTAG